MLGGDHSSATHATSDISTGALACLAAGLAIGLLTGCDLTSLSEQRQHLPDAFDTVQNTNLEPRYPQELGQQSPPGKPTPGASYYGQDANANASRTDAAAVKPADNGEGYELNFENAAVTTVAKVILGDILGVGYTIDPRVQGTVTLTSGRPVPKSDVPGEQAFPTQPFPVKPPPIARDSYRPEDLVTAEDTTAEHVQACRELVEKNGGANNAGPFTTWAFRAEGAGRRWRHPAAPLNGRRRRAVRYRRRGSAPTRKGRRGEPAQ